MGKYKVVYVIKHKGKTVGADILNIDNQTIQRINKDQFTQFKGNLTNAIVTSNNIIRAKKGNNLSIKELETTRSLGASESLGIKLYSNGQNERTGKVKHYTIMHENNEVLTIDRLNGTVTIHNKEYTPFGLRRAKGNYNIQVFDVIEWIKDRIDNLDRTYMNMVYIARGVGRDKDKIIKNSLGISFTDNFWIKTSDIKTTWNSLCELRDRNKALSNIALTGKIDTSKDTTSGYTSLFTAKGHFPKAIYGGYIHKHLDDAILEYPAYLIGKQLGINISECKINCNMVQIKIFTDNSTSLVHASELSKYFDADDIIYNNILELGRIDIVSQMQRMFIYNYIIGNPDLHEDNYGLLYNTKTFEFIGLSPCYDHNVAFQERFGGVSSAKLYEASVLPLDTWAPLFINNHPDIKSKLAKLDLKEVSGYLTNRQLVELKQRIITLIEA